MIRGIKKIGHFGESQGYAQVPSPFEMIQTPSQIRAKTSIKTKSGKREKASLERERRKNPGCHSIPKILCFCLFGEVVWDGVRTELLLYLGHAVVGQPHKALVEWALVPRP